jgi:hypothetical protein
VTIPGIDMFQDRNMRRDFVIAELDPTIAARRSMSACWPSSALCCRTAAPVPC